MLFLNFLYKGECALETDVKSKALRLILKKKRTEKEVIALLIKDGFSVEDAQGAALYYREKGYIDHFDYANRFTHDAAIIKGQGPKRISRDLQMKGIEEDIIEEVLSSISFDVYTLMAKRFGAGARSEKERNRIFQHYLRKGFAPSAIKEAMDALYTHE